MDDNVLSNKEIMLWGMRLPAGTLLQSEIQYLNDIGRMERPQIEWVWREMDRVWDVLGLDNRRVLQGQPIGTFYSHPVWVLNGVFSAMDPVSVQHREAIASFVTRLGPGRVADYGGGFGELALRLRAIAPKVRVDIVEPYPSDMGMQRVEEVAGIRFVGEFDDQYDCVIAQDVLEHVEQPLVLAQQMVLATKQGGYLLFANCFYPVMKCHLPSTLYLRHTFAWVVRGMGLHFVGRVEGVSHALVFRREGKISENSVNCLAALAKLIGPVLNASRGMLGVLKRGVIHQ